MASAIPNQSKENYTYGDYVHWDDGKRWEIIDGILIGMSPAPGTKHQAVLFELAWHIKKHFKDNKSPCEVFIAPFDVRMPEYDEADEEIRNVVQPDITIICDTSKIDEKGCRGVPDVVVEIVSPGSLRNDMKYKLILYENQGVKEYWIVQPAENILMQYCLNQEKRYDREVVFANEEIFESKLFPGMQIDLNLVFEA